MLFKLINQANQYVRFMQVAHKLHNLNNRCKRIISE